MSRTGSVKHIHQYYRNAKNGLWHCSGIDECTHYIPRNMPEPTGRKSICWGPCAQPFQLNPANMIDDRPKCDKCSEELDILSDVIEEMERKGKAERGIKEKPFDPLAAFRKPKTIHELLKETKRKEPKEPDEVEIIEPEEE